MTDQYKVSPASLFATATRQIKADRPEFVLAVLLSSFNGKDYEVITIKDGERGFYKTTWGRQTREWVAEQNALLGIDPATVAAYGTCSVFGNWGNYESVLRSMQEALSSAEETLCSCCDPIHPGDDKHCPIHGKGS
jgi:hypothetical protein